MTKTNIMPVERVTLAEFGALSAIDVGPDSVIVIELNEDIAWAPDTVARLREAATAAFPDNRVMALYGSYTKLRVIDLPPRRLTISIPTVATTLAVTTAVRIAMRLIGRRRAN